MRKKEAGSGIPVGVFSSNEVHDTNVAAFFDLDGTLLPLPPLERRLWSELRRRKRIRLGNYLSWLKEALRLLPRGISQVANANKAYLRGILAEEPDSLAIPPFFPAALQQVAWHAGRRHRIVILSGTLEPLALAAAGLLMQSVAALGVPARIEVCATRLELAAGSWTGRIVGEAMFGETKGRAVRRFCAARGIDPDRCFAYGDRAKDRWMLEAVGRPAAVNASDDLARIARRNGWPAFCWGHRRSPAQEKPSTRKNLHSEPTPASSQMIGDEVAMVTTRERESC